MKRTLIIGASPNTSRYANKAAFRLVNVGHKIVNIGIKKGEVAGEKILNGQPQIQNLDTIALYIGPKNQEHLYEYIISLKPKRIIFNPGTENDELIAFANKNNIEPVLGCTLVMLASKTY